MYVFGYGSLAGEAIAAGAPRLATLSGFRRRWDVAMDNLAPANADKYYVEPGSGDRPAVFITFLNLARTPDADCLGVLLEVDAHGLAALDRRERNYARIEVTEAITGAPGPGPVYTYLGLAAARARYAGAAAAGTAVITRAYLTGVETGFAAAGLEDTYRESTDAPEVPVVELARIGF